MKRITIQQAADQLSRVGMKLTSFHHDLETHTTYYRVEIDGESLMLSAYEVLQIIKNGPAIQAITND